MHASCRYYYAEYIISLIIITIGRNEKNENLIQTVNNDVNAFNVLVLENEKRLKWFSN